MNPECKAPVSCVCGKCCAMSVSNPNPLTLIHNWAELAQVPDSATHRLIINVRNGNGWIEPKSQPNKMEVYLTTHSFYGAQHTRISKRLQERGFNVQLANWDAKP